MTGKWNQKANCKAKNEAFSSTDLPVRTILYFMNRNQFIEASTIHNITLHPRWEPPKTMKIAVALVKPCITLTCCNSLINPMTNKFYFRFLIRMANETVKV